MVEGCCSLLLQKVKIDVQETVVTSYLAEHSMFNNLCILTRPQ